MPIRKIKRYGWKKDHPQRKHKYSISPPLVLPTVTDLRHSLAIQFDQGDLGSCTANAISAAVSYELKKQGFVFIPSRLFIYYNERVLEDSVLYDSGAEISDGIKSVATLGVCPEPEWPYIISQFAQAPARQCYIDAKKDIVSGYYSVQQDSLLQNLRTCIASGSPVVFGFSVYDSFESTIVAETGNAPLPAANESIVGGHAVLAMGYNDGPDLTIIPNAPNQFTQGKTYKWPSKTVLVQNSWGTDWGISGFFTIPYNYINDPNMADDFWTIRLVNVTK